MENSDSSMKISQLCDWLSTNISMSQCDDRVVRRNFLKDFQMKLKNSAGVLSEDDYREIFSISHRSLLGGLQDPVEKCRELSADVLKSLLQKQPSVDDDVLSLLMGTLVMCIGASDERESSEEVRLIEVDILSHIVKILDNSVLKYMNDIVHILLKCIVDPYPEIKYRSCECASDVAFGFREKFHLCSGSLINPLLKTITHQHSKTRVACIMAIGSVIQYGDNSGVKDVVSHLSQRLFDGVPTVRLAVVHVVGTWLIELPDRYSYFPNLIALLMSALSDEVEDVRLKAKELWEKSGEQFVQENEKDYKDQLDFPKPTPDDYPGCRPTFGCRVLVQRYYCTILPALLNDLGDWLPETRVKSADLLYTLMLHCEEKATMKLQMLIDAVVFIAKDEEKRAVDLALRTAELIGYFIDSELWSSHLVQLVSEKPCASHLGVLSAAIRGHGKNWNGSSFDLICETLADPNVCRLRKPEDQAHLLLCIEALLVSAGNLEKKNSHFLFIAVMSTAGLSTSNLLNEKCNEILGLLCSIQSMSSVSNLYEAHAHQVLKHLVTDHELWTTLSPEASIFIHLVQESCIIDEVATSAVPVIISNLQPDKDPKLRSQFLSLVKLLLVKVPMDKSSAFSSQVYSLMHDGMLPNLTWTSGKAAAALRTIAAANLWEVIRTGRFDELMLESIASDMLPVLNSLADDELAMNRLLACRILERCLPVVIKSVDEHDIHNTLQEFIRCLDDELDDTRVAATGVFKAYFNSFKQDYDWVAYRQYLKRIYKNMLVHMDDPNEDVRNAIFELLKEVSFALPETLLEEAEAVKDLMNAHELCTELTDHIKKLHLSKSC